MVMTSSQISAEIGAFQWQSLARAQNSQLGTRDPGAYASGVNPAELVGRGVNVAAAIGAPVAMGGLAMAGLDPFSMGLRGAGFAASRGAGLLGMGAAGAAAGIAAGLPLMAAQYVGGQGLQGIREQQQLSQAFGQSYGFVNQIGGRGFTHQQMSGIGSHLRTMSNTAGPGGELSSMGELSQLAANMGQMGMAGGVRDVRAFKERFSEMLKSVKEIATDLNTSLGEAQKMMSSMRSSGIFGTQNASAVARTMRNASLSGNVTTSDLGMLMHQGSQISRYMGGRGGAGAMAGLNAMTLVGGARESGLMSEEDIYNATGLTGAEGKRAFAGSMLKTSARFLQGRLGRWLTASVAGRDGELNEDAVEMMMSGGGVGETRSLAYSRLGEVGRANFIRNEKRLKGEVLGRFGGLAPAIALSNWAGSRGLDLNEGSDAAMIWLKRRAGLGQDEADMTLRMAKNLPELVKDHQLMSRQQATMSKHWQAQEHRGLSGLKHSLEESTQEFNNSLRQVGADIWDTLVQSTSDYVNKLTVNYLKEYRGEAKTAMRKIYTGKGTDDHLRVFGVGLDLSKVKTGASDVFGRNKARLLDELDSTGDLERLSDAGYGSLFEGAAPSTSLSGFDTARLTASRAAKFLPMFPLPPAPDLEARLLRRDGFSGDEVASENAAMRKGLDYVSGVQRSIGRGADAGLAKTLAGDAGAYRRALAAGKLDGLGADRIRSLHGLAGSLGKNSALARELAKVEGDGAGEARVLLSLAQAAGGKDALGMEKSLLETPDILSDSTMLSTNTSLAERYEKIGGAAPFLGARKLGAYGGRTLAGQRYVDKDGNRISQSDVGEAIYERNGELQRRAFSSDVGTVSKTLEEATDKYRFLSPVEKEGRASKEQLMDLMSYQSIAAAAGSQSAALEHGAGTKAYKRVIEEQAHTLGLPLEDYKTAASAVRDATAFKSDEALKRMFGTMKDSEKADLALLDRRGIEVEGGRVFRPGKDGLRSEVEGPFAEYLKLRKSSADAAVADNPEDALRLQIEESRFMSKERSVEEYDALGRSARSSGFLGEASRFEGLERSGRRINRGSMVGLGQVAGFHGDRRFLGELRRMQLDGKGTKTIAAALGERMGISDKEDLMADLTKAVESTAAGKGGLAAGQLHKVLGSDAFQEVQKSKQLESQKRDNPLLESIDTHLKEIRGALVEDKGGKKIQRVEVVNQANLGDEEGPALSG